MILAACIASIVNTMTNQLNIIACKSRPDTMPNFVKVRQKFCTAEFFHKDTKYFFSTKLVIALDGVSTPSYFDFRIMIF